MVKTKLSYKTQRKLDDLPERVEALGAEQAQISTQLANRSLLAKDGAKTVALQPRESLGSR